MASYDEPGRYSPTDGLLEDMPEKPPRPLYQRNQSFWRRPVSIAVHVAILAGWVTVAAFTIFYRMPRAESDTDLRNTYSPAQAALVPEAQVFSSKGKPDSPYAGEPSELQDAAWAELLRHTNVRFTEAEMDQISPSRREQGIALPDGGYFGSLQVFHDLHCIKHLHRFLYSEHYFPDLTPAQLDDRRMHMEHCLDMLRTGVMCRGDVTPLTMRWGHTQAIPLANFSSPHSCVSWDALNGWAREREVTKLFEPGYLRHPIFGDVYGEDFDNKIGIVHDS